MIIWFRITHQTRRIWSVTRLRSPAQAMGNRLEAMHLRDQAPFIVGCYADQHKGLGHLRHSESTGPRVTSWAADWPLPRCDVPAAIATLPAAGFPGPPNRSGAAGPPSPRRLGWASPERFAVPRALPEAAAACRAAIRQARVKPWLFGSGIV